MNKKLVLALTFGLLFSTTGCNNSTPVYEDFEDSYTDALPSNSEDGTTLHAFCWTFNQIKENLPNIANAGFKNVLTMPVQQPKGGGASWWAYYQPISFTIADNSALGTKDDLKSLCEEADKYNISILVDVVANHMANISDDELEDDKTPKVSPSVESYEPILYRNRNENVDGEHGVTFHHNLNANGSGAETQVYQYGALPDLNTGNEYVQQRVYSLLKECIDVGVDGFRFDAAKHIETSEDPEYASDFWENTLDKAKVYYNEKTNKNLYAYGEILGSPLNRTIDLYTKHMRVTEDGYTSQFKGSTATHNASQVLNASLTKADANESIAWVESHDEYTSTKTHIGNSKVAKFWGVIASRKDLGGLYLARPNSESQVGIIGDYQFETEYTACANRFHNRFVGASEYPSADGAIYVNERIASNDQGAYVLNLDEIDVTKEVRVSLPHLDNGNYYDLITGNKVVVHDHAANIKFDIYGMAFLTRTNQKAHPTLKISERSGSFASDKVIEVETKNCEEAYYSFNDETTTTPIVDKANISLKDHVLSDNTVKLNITLKNGTHVLTRTFTYNKVVLIDGYFNVVNLKANYFTDYEIYMWSWEPGRWSKDYTIQDGVLLVDTKGMTGFLLALFEKDYVVEDTTKWDSNNIKQSVDIKGSTLSEGFFDASNF